MSRGSKSILADKFSKNDERNNHKDKPRDKVIGKSCNKCGHRFSQTRIHRLTMCKKCSKEKR